MKAGEKNAALPALLCLCGFFLHILLSGPLLEALGMHYTGDEGRVYEKLHPGTWLIYASFVLLLWGKGGAFARATRLFHEYTPYVCLLALYVLLFVYMGVRSGFAGLAFLVDTHMTVPICAIVLSCAPPPYCRRAAHGFIALAALNSAIGIAEGLGKFRLFAFDPQWTILHDPYFRASALLGHPLNNAMFTSVALFVAMGLGYSRHVKAALIALFLVSLAAFGGRMGVLTSLAGLGCLAIAEAAKILAQRQWSLRQMFLAAASAIVLPACLAAGGYLILQSGIGERIVTHLQWEESANSRWIAFSAFGYMTGPEKLFGVSVDRVVDIAYRMNLSASLSDIENPWLLMIMFLGWLAFPFWLAVTGAFALRLMRNQPLALKLAVIAYFLTASTSNSFGRKDSIYLIMVCAVICVSRMGADMHAGRELPLR